MNSDMQERRFALLLHTGHGERSAFRKVRHMDDASIISELKSLGPKSQEILSRAGITSVAQLRDLGSVEAYVRAKGANPGVSLNLLWALESALSGEPWQKVARIHRTSLLLAVEEREKNAQPFAAG